MKSNALIHITEDGKYTLCGHWISPKWSIGSGEVGKRCQTCTISTSRNVHAVE